MLIFIFIIIGIIIFYKVIVPLVHNQYHAYTRMKVTKGLLSMPFWQILFSSLICIYALEVEPVYKQTDEDINSFVNEYAEIGELIHEYTGINATSNFNLLMNEADRLHSYTIIFMVITILFTFIILYGSLKRIINRRFIESLSIFITLACCWITKSSTDLYEIIVRDGAILQTIAWIFRLLGTDMYLITDYIIRIVWLLPIILIIMHFFYHKTLDEYYALSIPLQEKKNKRKENLKENNNESKNQEIIIKTEPKAIFVGETNNKHTIPDNYLFIILPVTFIGLIIYFTLRNNSTNIFFPIVENQIVENSDTKDYEQRINSIIRELSSKYENEVCIENNFSESSKYCSFWLKDESGSNRYLLIYNLENGNHKKFDTQNINTINGGEIYITNCGTCITPNNRILIEGDNGANSIGYTKYVIEINPSDWQAKEICSGAEIVKDTNGYLVKKIIMSKWNTCNADSEYISIEIMYDLNGNLTLPSSYEQAYKLHGLIDDKYPITMNLAMSDTQLYGKYYYDKNGDNNNFLYLFGGVSKSGDIIILEYNKQGDQTSKFKGRIINNSFSGIFTNYKKIDMPFKLIFSSNNINNKVRKFICNGDMAGFPIEMDIIVNEDNTVNGEYRNVKYKVNYDLTGRYNNGHFSIKGHHGKALVEFNLSIDNNTIIGHGSDGKNTLNVKMNYTINNENEYSTDVNINTISYKNYYNSRFNFTVKYPSFLSNITQSDNGDGCMFSKDSNTYLKVYGMHNALNSTIEEEFNKYKSQSPIYSLQKNNWFVISDYTEDGHIYYLITVLRNNVFITGYIQYPSDQKDLYSKIITEIFKNFPN